MSRNSQLGPIEFRPECLFAASVFGNVNFQRPSVSGCYLTLSIHSGQPAGSHALLGPHANAFHSLDALIGIHSISKTVATVASSTDR